MRRFEGRIRRLMGVSTLALAGILLVGCKSGDFELHVRNTTDQTWLVKVAIGGDWGPNDYWVSRVLPGANGLAFGWNGEEDEPIQLLNESCAVIGVFTKNPDGTYGVAEVPGISGTISSAPHRFPQPRPTPELIEGTPNCGGMILM